MYILKSRQKQKKQHLFNTQKTNLLACQHLGKEIASSDQYCLSYSSLFKTSSFQWDRVGWQHPGQKCRKKCHRLLPALGCLIHKFLKFLYLSMPRDATIFLFPLQCVPFPEKPHFNPQMLSLETCRLGQTTTPSYATASFISATQKFSNVKSFHPWDISKSTSMQNTFIYKQRTTVRI